jgi:hypothetical protein
MLVSGLPDRTEHHAKHASDVAMDMVQAIQNVKITFLKEPLTVKLGMHSGPVVAGSKVCFLLFLCLDGYNDNSKQYNHEIEEIESHFM